MIATVGEAATNGTSEHVHGSAVRPSPPPAQVITNKTRDLGGGGGNSPWVLSYHLYMHHYVVFAYSSQSRVYLTVLFVLQKCSKKLIIIFRWHTWDTAYLIFGEALPVLLSHTGGEHLIMHFSLGLEIILHVYIFWWMFVYVFDCYPSQIPADMIARLCIVHAAFCDDRWLSKHNILSVNVFLILIHPDK